MTTSAAWVTACIPTFRCTRYLRDAVVSLLNQTYPYLRVIVMNDGDPEPPWPMLADIADPRLIRFDLRENRGPFFATAVALEATPDPFFLIQDADDWSAPHRVATLLRLLQRDGSQFAFSTMARFYDPPEGDSLVGRVLFSAGPDYASPAQFRWRAPHQGLFRTEAVRHIGGYYGGFRYGYDQLLLDLLLMVGTVSWTPDCLYWYRKRANSVTEAADTGLRSPIRRLAQAELQEFYGHIYGDYEQFLARRISGERLLQLIRWRVETRRGAADTERISAHAARLRRAMTDQYRAFTAHTSRVSNAQWAANIPKGGAWALLERCLADGGRWSAALGPKAEALSSTARQLLEAGKPLAKGLLPALQNLGSWTGTWPYPLAPAQSRPSAAPPTAPGPQLPQSRAQIPRLDLSQNLTPRPLVQRPIAPRVPAPRSQSAMPRPSTKAAPIPKRGPTPSVKAAQRTAASPIGAAKRPALLRGQFVILDDFLPRHELDELTQYTLAHKADFKRSEVVPGGGGASSVAYEFRRSRVLMNPAKHETRLVNRMKKHMTRILKRLAHRAFPMVRVDTQITASNDGDFFKMHSDSGERDRDPREMTFVYFFHREPKPFEGGELRIYDARLENGDYVSTGKYQAIVPKRNRIVFFPSELLHEVMPVRCPSRAFADSRFTFNGWLLRR